MGYVSRGQDQSSRLTPKLKVTLLRPNLQSTGTELWVIKSNTGRLPTDREVFLTYLDELLCPKLKPDDVVVMDNLSTHHMEEVRQRIEATGAELLYLPPYSPDLNPIEKAWSKLKQLMGASKARSVKALDDAIETLLPQITSENAQAWFRGIPSAALGHEAEATERAMEDSARVAEIYR